MMQNNADVVPKIIWMLWLQGWQNAPEIVRACFKTWEAHNPDWTIHALDAASLPEYLEMAELKAVVDGKDVPHEAYSDLIRIALLERYGGVWADGTVYCLKPLDAWLPEKCPAGFFAFAKPGPDRMLSSWFLAATKGNYLVREWRRQSMEYWKQHTQRHHYFWFHYLFAESYTADKNFRAVWDATPVWSADGPHHYAPYKALSAPVSTSDYLLAETAPTPVLKLTHKLPDAEYHPDSVLKWLCTRAVAPQKIPATKKNLLVCWYGSFADHGTIGDLLAMQSVVTHLVGLGYNVSHASAAETNIVGSRRVEWRAVSPESFDAFIFTCGPIMKDHSHLQALFKHFEGVQKIGVSVSLFPEGHFNHFNPFDEVLAREGGAEAFTDVALVAPPSFHRPPRPRSQSPTIGIILSAIQCEFGENLCQWEMTGKIAHETANKLIATHGGRIVAIENHLQRSGLTPEAIEALYADCDLIITSRFHGAIMAMRHLVPFIAIDQIKGGAKVHNLVGATGWPFIYLAEKIDSDRLASDALKLIAGDFDQLLLDVRMRTTKQANQTLNNLDKVLRQSLTPDQFL